MSKCKKCKKSYVSYGEYFCDKCKKEKAGIRPRKSKELCAGCHDIFYMNKYEGKGGCWSYKDSKVVLKQVYYSSSQVIPDIKWRLNCYH